MARPSRCRRICLEPAYDSFAPDGIPCGGKIVLTVDEYETIRLIDWKNLTQEQCAKQMDISRTTVTEVYKAARQKIADSIIHGKTLLISGGHYELCDGSALPYCQTNCKKAKGAAQTQTVQMKGADTMRIAVTYENGKVFQHFGHTQQFKIYDAANGQITQEQIVDTNDSGHGALAGFLSSLQVDVLICGGIGGGAQAALAQAGIRLFGGVNGDADAAAESFVAGTLSYDPNAQCSHHGHGHHESGHCSESKHGCSGHGGACQ